MKKPGIKIGLISAMVLLYCAWAVLPVTAHALLIRSIPEANASLPISPIQVELFFSEIVQGGISSIQVVDTNAMSVDLGDVRVDPTDPTHMTVSLHTLKDGIYTVSWKAISATDGHLTMGSFPFAVGNVEAIFSTQTTTEKKSADLSGSSLGAKWLFLIALVVLVGRMPFKFLIWHPSLKQSEIGYTLSDEPAVWAILARLALIVLLFSIGLGMLSEAGQINGSELALPWGLGMGLLLTSTRLGVVWLVRLLLASTAIGLVLSKSVTWKNYGVFGLGLLLLLSESITSHAASVRHPFLPVLADWVHLVMMSFWVGGLVYFSTGLREIRLLGLKQRTALTSLLILHFSVLALICVGVVVISGIYSAILRIGLIPALFNTSYGQMLLLKLALVAPLVGLGAINLLIISPRLNRDRIKGISNLLLTTRFRLIVLGELSLACIVIFAATLLTSLPPPHISSTTANLTGRTKVDDLNITLTVSPGWVGINTFTLRLTSGGQPVQSVKEALLRFTPNHANLPPSEVQLIAKGNGDFSARGANLSMADTWQVQSVVRREGNFNSYANFNFTVVTPVTSSLQPNSTSRVSGGLVVSIGLILLFTVFIQTRRLTIQIASAVFLSVVLMGLGILIIFRTQPYTSNIINPILPNSQSIAAGKFLFTRYCEDCHGISGKGDGPVGLTFNPRPADLTQHAIPGVHTDVQLFEFISEGVSNSRMPSFNSSLSDIDRWNLVNYIRTMAQ